MYILAIDTSAKSTSVALLEKQHLCAEYFLHQSLPHSQTMMPLCEQLLKQTQKTLQDVNVLAVAIGPGSFTGLRIGLAAVKGMAYGLNKLCFGVSTLQALSWGVVEFNGIVCCVMDARCEQVYCGLFLHQKGKRTILEPEQGISIAELGEKLKRYKDEILLVGDGAMLCYEALKTLSLSLVVASGTRMVQRASSVGFYAWHAMQQGEKPIAAQHLEPTYLRLAQAQRQLLERALKTQQLLD